MELNRVLIVDDDPAIRRVVSALLDLDEYGLLEAADGQAAGPGPAARVVLDMIKTLGFVVEAKDPSTRAHLQRTHDYAVALAEAVDPELAADEQLRHGFLLHDVGKVGIPEAVLNKPGPLDPDE